MLWYVMSCILPGTDFYTKPTVPLEVCSVVQMNSRFLQPLILRRPLIYWYTDKATLHSWNLESDTACCYSAEPGILLQDLALGPLTAPVSWLWRAHWEVWQRDLTALGPDPGTCCHSWTMELHWCSSDINNTQLPAGRLEGLRLQRGIWQESPC